MLAVAEANEQAAEYVLSYEDLALVVALRDGDEAAFVELVRRYRAQMLQVARLYVPTQAVAEEVVQETWLGVLNGIGRFQGRSSFKTWLFRILDEHRADPSRAREAHRSVLVARPERARDGRAVGRSRSLHPARRALGELLGDVAAGVRRTARRSGSCRRRRVDVARAAIDELPPAQRAVITMRDVVGFSTEEVCNALELSEGNQRVLLHRARAKVRARARVALRGGRRRWPLS